MPLVYDDDAGAPGGRLVFDDEQKQEPRGRTAGEIITDTGASALGGLNNLAKLPAMAIDKAVTGEWIGPGVEALNEFGDVINFQKSEPLRQREQAKNTNVHAAGKAAEEWAGGGKMGTAARIAAEFGVGVKEAVSDPALLASSVAEQLPTLGVMRAVGVGADKLAGAAVRSVPKVAATRAGQAVAAKAGTVAAVGTGAALQGADIGSDVYQRMLALPDSEWQNHPDFAALAEQLGPDDAKRKIAAREGFAAAQKAGVATILTTLLPGGDALEKALVGRGPKASLGAVVNAVKGEARQEGLEEGFGQLYGNQAVATANWNQDLAENVGGAAGEGAVLGGIMGGGGTAGRAGRDLVAAGADRLKREPETEIKPAPPAAQAPNYPDTVSRETPPVAPTEAERALREPSSLTALDRAGEITAEQGRISQRLAELNDPAGGYGQMFDQERQQLGVQAQELAAERDSITRTWPKAEPGQATSFTTEAGARLDGQYALVEANDLITSHDENLRQNPLYPQELQPRARDRAASEMQISGIVQKLDPARLGLSADAATGAPIVGADGLVESGNARTIALKRVYQASGQKAADYRQFLVGNAAQFGLAPEQIQGMAKPVLVRVRTTPVNRAEFARQANASTVAAMSPSEQAKSDAARIDSMEDLSPDEQGDFQASRDFIRRFMARLPVTEQSGMIDSTGALSSAGYARVRNAVLAKAYGDSPVLMRMVESMDDNLRNVSKALMTAAPKVAQMRQAVAQGQRFDADITPDLMAAVEELSRLKDAGTSIHDALAQGGMFGDKYSQETRDLLQFLADNIRRPRRMAEFITAYMEALDAAGDPNQGSLLGETQAPAKADLLAAAGRTVQGERDAQESDTTREAGQDPGPGQQGRGEPEDAQGGEGRTQSDGPAADAGAQGEWVAFGPETGTLGIPRAEMPQVKNKDRGALINFLEARGITHENDRVPASSLKPTQAEYSRNKVDKFVETGAIGERSVLISSDGHVLDGHHQWLGHKERGEEINVIRLDSPIRELLESVNAFPGVKRSEGAADVTQLRAAAVQDFKDALADLAQIATKHTRAAMIPEDTPGLKEALVKLFDAALRIVGTDMRAATRWVRDQLRQDPATKKIANFIKTSTMEDAARQALAQIEKSGAAQGVLFDSPEQASQALQGGLFGAQAGATLEEPVKVAKINGRAYDMKRDNFKPKLPPEFLTKDQLKQADEYVAKYYKPAAPVDVPAQALASAEAAVRPLLKKAEDTKAAFDQKVIDIARKGGALGQMLVPIKSLNRAAEKVALDYAGDASQIKDLLRSTIVVQSYSEAPELLDVMRSEFDVLSVKDKTTPEARARNGGYADFTVFVGMPNGVKAEIQINAPPMLSIKEHMGHKLYEAARAMRALKVPDADRIYAAMEEIYDAAFALGGASLKVMPPAGAPAIPAASPVGRSSDASSENLNQRPSGNITNSSPEKVGTNTQPSGNFSGTGIDIASPRNESVPQLPANGYEAPAAATNNRDSFTLERLNRETNQMEPVTFERGEYVELANTVAASKTYGEIDGISQARREFKVGGVWYPFGAAYKAQRPARPSPDTVPLSSVIAKINAKNDQGLTDADRVPAPQPASKTPTVDAHEKVMVAVRDGTATPEQFKASFETVVAGKDAILAELATKTKAELLRDGGYFLRMRYANESKPEIVDAAYRELVGEYVLGETLSYGMGKGAYEAAVRRHVEATDADKLAQYAKDRQAAIAEAQAKREARAAALENPQTLDDFRSLLNVHIREGKTRKEAFLMLTPGQRVKYDEMESDSTREAREARKRAIKTSVRAAGQTTGGEIIATKHTRDGYDLFVVQLADRVSKEDYQTLLSSAKRMGGWYSSFRGNGAVPGFQFKDRAQAEAFKALAGGDTAAAQEQVAARRDAFEDDRSQSAVERLTAMAEKLDEQVEQALNVERKTNTARRARFASAAEAQARQQQALAKTMRNIAQASEAGKAKFLDSVRTKTQVEMLAGAVRTAKDNELRAKYDSYAEQQKRKGQPPTAETADYAEFPSFTAFRSDLASLARQMLEVEGTKKLGTQLMKVADDVTDAYMEFAKANQLQVSRFGNKAGGLANFASREDAGRAIKRSGLVGKAIVLPVKRGENRVILSPSEAMSRGIWTGDGDKRITLTREFGQELVDAIGRRGNKSNGLSVPWQFEGASDRLKALARIGIETPAEYRSALREFIGLQEQAKEADRVKMLERAMVGKTKDGLDFFPTPQTVADQMVEAADIEPDMAVLEPSAGMGHIADRIREAGAEPDVIEMANDRAELLEAKGFNVMARDFMEIKPREWYTFGDVFRAADGTEGIMRGAGGMGSNRVRLVNEAGDMLGYYDRDELTGSRLRGTESGYDRIIMNPPFSDRRDAQHVRHAFELLRPGGRLVAIMGEGVFFGQDKKAQDFRDWLEEVGGTDEKLSAGTFMDPSLPVNTGVSARMVVIDKPSVVDVESSEDGAGVPRLSRGTASGGMAMRDLEAVVARVSKGLKNLPKVNVFASPSDLSAKVPEQKALRDFIKKQGAMEDAEGGLHNGEFYLFASGLADEARAEHVLVTHELTHYGLRGALGKDLDAAMQHVWVNNARIRKEASTLRERLRLPSNLDAVEEVLAEIPASELVTIKGWRRVVKAVRDWLGRIGATALATRLDQWLHAGLDAQARADLFVGEMLMAAREWVRTGRGGRGGGVMADVTRLSSSLAEDVARQEKWLTAEAKARGYADIEDLLAKNYPLFEKLAAKWREKNPADGGVMLSRAPQPTTAAERAEKILATKAGSRAPLDFLARTATRITGVERLTGAIYSKAGYLLDRYTPEMVKAGVVADYGVPEAVIDQRAMMQGRQRVQLRKAGALIEKLATLTRAESRVAYEWMNMDGSNPKAYLSAMDGLPEESVKVLQEVQQMIDKLSREAVAMGQLSPDAYERNRFAYLRRSYAKHVLEQDSGEKAKRARVISILGDQYKGRGLTEAAPMAKIQNTAPEWWGRKLQAGKGDADLKGERFVRLERRAPAGAGTQALPGMTGRPDGRLLEVAYYPAGQALPAQFADWEKRGTFEVRDVKGPNLILWRDFTKEEREQMGEVDEARFAIAKTLHGMIHDVEVGRYLEWVGHTYGKKEGETIPGTVVEASERYRDTFAPGEWVRVPDAKISGTTVAKYGKLAGRYIPGPVWNDLRQVVGGQFKPFGDTYSKILTLWKTAKTALSPAVHMNNVMSNFVMADWHDVGAAHVAKSLRLILAASQRQGAGALGRAGNVLAGAGIADRAAALEILNRYKDSGGDIGSWATNEIARDQLEPLLADLEKELAATAGASQQAQVGVMAALQHALMLRFPSAWDAFKASKAGKAVGTEAKSLIDLYQSEDDVFRLAAWLKAKEDGKGDLEAGKAARRSFLDYHINAPWIQAMRSTAWPFISFTYRAVPMLLETAGKKPHKLLKLMMIAGGLNALGAMLAGGGDDDERKLLPEEKAGRIWGVVPKLIRMPWNDQNGHPVYLDIRRFIPVGDVLDVSQGHAAIPVLPGLQPGGPMALIAELMVNRSMFTGKPVTLDTDTFMQKVAKVSDYLYKAFAPNILGLPGTYATTGVVNAAQGKTDAFGRQQSVAQAAASAFGVKLGSYPADVMKLNLTRKAQAELMEIDRNVTLLKRQRMTNQIDQAEFEKLAKVEQEKKRKIVEKLREKIQ